MSVPDDLFEAWNHYVRGQYDIAHRNYTVFFEAFDWSSSERKLELAAFNSLFLPQFPFTGKLSTVCCSDPFRKRAHIIPQSTKERLRLLATVYPNESSFEVFQQLIELARNSHSDSDYELNALLGLYTNSLGNLDTRNIEACLQRSMELAVTLDQIDFADVCSTLYSISAMTFNLSGDLLYPWRIEDKIKQSEIASFLLFSIEKCLEIADWLETCEANPTKQAFTSPTLWRNHALEAGLILLQTCVVTGDCVSGKKATDTMIAVLKLSTSSGNGYRWDGEETVCKPLGPSLNKCFIHYRKFLNPFDKNLSNHQRMFYLQQFLRVQQTLQPPGHRAIERVKEELQELGCDDFSVEEFFPKRSDPSVWIDIDPIRDTKVFDKIRDECENFHIKFLSFITERWTKRPPHDVRIFYSGRMHQDRRVIRLREIREPDSFTKYLTPDSVHELIDIVNGASDNDGLGAIPVEADLLIPGRS